MKVTFVDPNSSHDKLAQSEEKGTPVSFNFDESLKYNYCPSKKVLTITQDGMCLELGDL